MKCDVKTLKLTNHISTSNMVLFGKDNQLKKFDTIDDIIEEFCQMRFKYYVLRKKHQLKVLEHHLKILKNKRKFLEDVMEENLIIYKKDYNIIVDKMKELKYDLINKTYDYLLNMNIRSFTDQKLKEIEKDIDNLNQKLKKLNNITPEKLWINDLDKFLKEYKKI